MPHNTLEIAQTAIPTLMTPLALDAILPPFELNHARVLYDNLLVSSLAQSPAGSGAELTLSPNTADRFTSPVSDYITYQSDSNILIDSVGVGGHNLFDGGYSVLVQYRESLLTPLVDFGTFTPTSNAPILIHLNDSISARILQVTFVGGSGDIYVSSVYAGIALQMQRPYFSGSTPINLAPVTDYYSSRSESGNFIGRQIRKREFMTSAAWKNLDEVWLRTYFLPFVESAKSYPFFFAWNLRDYPSDVGYVMTTSDIKPSYQGVRKLMQVDIDMVGV